MGICTQYGKAVWEFFTDFQRGQSPLATVGIGGGGLILLRGPPCYRVRLSRRCDSTLR